MRAVSLATSPPRSRLRTHHLATKLRGELLSVASLSEAEDLEVRSVEMEAVATAAKAEPLAFAEEPQLVVVVAGAEALC